MLGDTKMALPPAQELVSALISGVLIALYHLFLGKKRG